MKADLRANVQYKRGYGGGRGSDYTDKKDSYTISAVSAYEKSNDGKEIMQKRTANINKRQGIMVGQCSCYGSSQNLLTKEAEW